MARNLLRQFGGDAWVAVGLMLGNVLGYALALVAARRLGPDRFGELSAFLAVVIVLAVLPTGLQTVVARAVADGRAHPLSGLTHRQVLLGALAATGVAAPVVLGVGQLIHASVIGSILVAALLAPLTVLGWAQGLSQGREDFSRLGNLLVLNNGGRALGAIGGVLVVPTADAALAGSLLAATACATWALLSATETSTPVGDLVRAHVTEVLLASVSLLALFLCTNADVVLARGVLPGSEAGLYAAGAVMAKAAFWLPQFVAVTALPRLVTQSRRRTALRWSATAVAVLSALVVLTALVFDDEFVSFIGGSGYAALAPTLPWFAVVGSLWALNQVMLYDALARRVEHPALPLWAALVLMTCTIIVLPSPSVDGVVHLAAAAAVFATAWYGLLLLRTGQVAEESGHGPGANVEL